MKYTRISLLFLTLLGLMFTACKKDDIKTGDDLKVELTDTTASYLSVVNLLDDTTAVIFGKVGDESTAEVSFSQNSKYTLIAPDEQTLQIKNASGELLGEATITTTLGKTYSAYVTGSISSPSIQLVEDDLSGPADVSYFNSFGLNLSDKASISYQVYYPQYSLWATAGGWFEEMAPNTLSPAVSYTGGIPLNVRAIIGLSEEYRDYTQIQGQAFHAGSTDVVVTPSDAFAFEANKTYSIVLTGSNGNYRLTLVSNSDAL